MQLWDLFLREQEKKLGKETIKKWLLPLKLIRFDARNIVLEAKDSFQILWFEEHIRKEVMQFFIEKYHPKVKVFIQSEPGADKKKKVKVKKITPPTVRPPAPFSLQFDPINPLCTFENYVITKENEFLSKIAIEMTGFSKNLPPKWGQENPLYIYGKKGSGKTHFLMAISHEAKKQGLKAIYVRAETFIDHVVAAIRGGEMSLFRQTYRSADVLLLDDIDVFSRKGGTQEEFFHTFNSLHLASKQIVLAAHVAPHELQMIEPRLVSRFEWGVVCSLAVFEGKDLFSLLQKKAEAMKVYIPEKILEFLVDTFQSGPKSIIQALEALILRKHLLEQEGKELPLVVSSVKLILEDLIREEKKIKITAQEIIRTVTEYFGIRIEDIMGKAQTKECVLPRQIAMHLCRYLLKVPYMKIGEIFARDHSTVMSSVQLIEQKLQSDEKDVLAAWRKITYRLKP